MAKEIPFAIALSAMALSTLPAKACVIWTEPPLPGETNSAYEIRVEALRRRQAAERLKERQADALEQAQLIFIARDTVWTPSYPSPPAHKARPGRPPPFVPPPRPPVIEFPGSSYYKPIDWFRGARSTRVFSVKVSETSCGPMSIGDTTNGTEGDLYVFFARKGPLSEKTLIDAIALDTIDHPALNAFVAKHRKAPPLSR
ncbi:hypothetical protein K9B35_09795 [Sphingomonas sp. R647]|uniref:hypothetical protein n=1 Tax=Sphingomonas sp. R647 TaxID=2875233 RepID=UPI001CD36B15|nr:hypothetical protein [Sphingomonas sp. R647]MCA1198259.1 hypothetical protein [Sphingomonas sp. R647]